MQRAQSGAQAAQCGAVRALMRHWPVAAAAAVAWPIDAGSAMPGACGHWVGARGALARVRGRPAASGQRAPANRRRRSARAPRCWELAKLVAFDAGSAAGLVGAPRAPRDGEEVGNHHSNCTYTSDPPAPRLGSEQGAGSADPTHRARETGRHNARLLEQASYLQVQSNNPACWSSLFSSSGAA